jgi:phosphotransferase system HPr (HPr) family protein
MSGARRADDVKVTKELLVINKLGIHARPAALFVKTANRFDCEILVEKDGEQVNGKSIMGLMMLAAGPEQTADPCRRTGCRPRRDRNRVTAPAQVRRGLSRDLCRVTRESRRLFFT